MLGWVTTYYDDRAQDMLHRLEKKYNPLEQCQAVGFWCGLSSNMLGYMMYHTLHATDSGEGVVSLTGTAGATPYRVVSLINHKHPQCEVISGTTYPLLERMLLSRELLSSSAFHDCIVAFGSSDVSSLWHQQQKNPPLVLRHNLYEYQSLILMTLLLQ